MLKKSEILSQFEKAKMLLVNEFVCDENSVKAMNAEFYKEIYNRASELMKQFPEKTALFEGYLQNQREENILLETEAKCATFVIQKYSDEKAHHFETCHFT